MTMWNRRQRDHAPFPATERRAIPTEEALEERLRNLEWPKPPPGVKERVLANVLARLDEMQREDEAKKRAQNGGDPQRDESGDDDSDDDLPSFRVDRLQSMRIERGRARQHEQPASRTGR